MKNIIKIIVILSVFSCKAQTIIIPLDSNQDYENSPDYYIKDINNDLNKFEGTWKYQNGTTEITIILKKELHYTISNEDNHEDLLVGEYQYIEDSIEKVNTLNDIDNPSISGYDHIISGNNIVRPIPYFCIDNSDPLEKKVWVFIGHPTDEFVDGRLYMRYVNEAGVEKLEACIFDETNLSDSNILDIPEGSYVFIKQ